LTVFSLQRRGAIVAPVFSVVSFVGSVIVKGFACCWHLLLPRRYLFSTYEGCMSDFCC